MARHPLALVLLCVFTHAPSRLSRGTVLPTLRFVGITCPLQAGAGTREVAACACMTAHGMQGSHEQEASSRYNSGYGASTSAASSARSANISTLSCQATFVNDSFSASWVAGLHCSYAGLSFPIAVTTCAANRHKAMFPAVMVLMESLLSKQQHLHDSLQWP